MAKLIMRLLFCLLFLLREKTLSELSQLVKQVNKKWQYMKNRREQINYLTSLKDEDIDFSDAPEVTDFTNWQPNPFFKPVKAQLSAKVDKDIIAWLKNARRGIKVS